MCQEHVDCWRFNDFSGVAFYFPVWTHIFIQHIELKYTVGTESIQTPLKFSLFVILQPFAKII